MHAWFSAIPQPQPSPAAVRNAFGHPCPEAGDYMAGCVAERSDGYHLLTDVVHATTIAAHRTRAAYWDAVDAVAAAAAPTLLVRTRGVDRAAGSWTSWRPGSPVPGHPGHLVHAAAPQPYLAAVHALLDATAG